MKQRSFAKNRMTRIVAYHYFKLMFRSLLLLAAGVTYIRNRIKGTGELFGGFERNDFVLGAIWVFFLVGMVLRFFPSKTESMGCQKQFSANYRPIAGSQLRPSSRRVTLAVALSFLSLNAAIGALYFVGWIDAGILILIALLYSVCDVICILFFCPFQTWFMKNKCCATCRIYNWDYAMMFTPLIFIPHPVTYSLVGLSLLLLLQWEIKLHRFPERFCETTNASLHCENCKEKLCKEKNQLRHFLQRGVFDRAGNWVYRVKGRKK